MTLGKSLYLTGGADAVDVSKSDAATVAIIGGGPRGISVLERLLMRCAGTGPLTIDLYDQVSPGNGRVWDPRQSAHLLMNTPAQEVTIFSGPPDSGPVRAGAGPSLAQWSPSGDRPEYSGYETRRQYGRYLRCAVEAMVAAAPGHVTVRMFTGTVVEILTHNGDFTVRTETGELWAYDSVVLATGHPQPESPSLATKTGTQIILGDSAADLSLDLIDGGDTVAAIGMGLGFHDVVALLTQGRGGSYTESSSGELEYRPGGSEPTIVGVSRSGLPILARGRNEKPASFSFTPRLCTVQRMSAQRRSGQLDFARDVYPWIMAEAAATFCATHIAARAPGLEAEFLTQVTALGAHPSPMRAVQELGNTYGVTETLPDLDAMARPFARRRYRSQAAWTRALRAHLRADLAEAEQGNLSNPLKAALDTLRDLRPAIRTAVNHGGLTPESHERDFVTRFTPAYSILAAGPPARRNQELLALMRCGIVRVAGPHAAVTQSDGRTRVVSPAVPEAIEVDITVDTRIPPHRIGEGRTGLYRQLLADGLVRRYCHEGVTTMVETGACDTDPETGQAIGADGTPVAGLFVVGIPTERQRWFTQIGNGRPGVTTEFSSDADRVATHCLNKLAAAAKGMAR